MKKIINVKFELVYKWETFEEFVEKIYEKVPEIKKKKLILDKHYSVRKWDSLHKIWKRFGLKKKWISLEAFKKFNRLKSNEIKVWQELKIPKVIEVFEKAISKEKLDMALKRQILKILENKWIVYRYKYTIIKSGKGLNKQIVLIRNGSKKNKIGFAINK